MKGKIKMGESWKEGTSKDGEVNRKRMVQNGRWKLGREEKVRKMKGNKGCEEDGGKERVRK